MAVNLRMLLFATITYVISSDNINHVVHSNVKNSISLTTLSLPITSDYSEKSGYNIRYIPSLYTDNIEHVYYTENNNFPINTFQLVIIIVIVALNALFIYHIPCSISLFLLVSLPIASSQECAIGGGDSTYTETLVNGNQDRRIVATGCPNHRNDPINPNPAIFQNKDVTIPAFPCISNLEGGWDVTCIGGSVGIFLNGVSVFSQYAATYCGDDAVQIEGDTFDNCGGHATRNGDYHYHIAPGCLLDQLFDAKTPDVNGHSPQIGWAYDGFPIYGPHDLMGKVIHPCTDTNADISDCLDECNGHDQHNIHGFLYHYHILGPVGDLSTTPVNPLPRPRRAPYTIGCLKGIATHRRFPGAQCIESGTTENYNPITIPGVTDRYIPTPIPTQSPTAPTTGQPTSITGAPIPTVAPIPPNFLVILLDDFEYIQAWDHSYQSMGTELKGETIDYFNVAAPNIGNFIRDSSIVIPRTYSSPQCAPSRYALITGRYPPRNEFARLRTQQTIGSLLNGTRVTVPFTKMTENDQVFNIPTVLRDNPELPYSTGMVGKWHMTQGSLARECADLTLQPNTPPGKYDQCVADVEQSGFDFVDALFTDNIQEEAAVGHNPEWLVTRGQRFIEKAIMDQKPWFLYFAPTLTHKNAPDLLTTLTSSSLSATHTPKGTLILPGLLNPSTIGMKDRATILAEADAKVPNRNNPNWEQVAGVLWVDDMFGAMIEFLKMENIYDDTFIVLMNDHGQGAKGLLFEQGSRQIQFIRYPKLFNIQNPPFIVPEEFITSEVDISAVIFEIVNQNQMMELMPPMYVLDGKSWLSDIINVIEEAEDVITRCCAERFMSIEQSHSIITRDFQYIWRATSVVEGPIRFYSDGTDQEQLYDLTLDPNEQMNVKDDPNYLITLCEFKAKMIEYFESVAGCDDDVLCNVPDDTPCFPSRTPTISPTNNPMLPTITPTNNPILPTITPTISPTNNPTLPTISTTKTDQPTAPTVEISDFDADSDTDTYLS
eukprot:509127_1